MKSWRGLGVTMAGVLWASFLFAAPFETMVECFTSVEQPASPQHENLLGPRGELLGYQSKVRVADQKQADAILDFVREALGHYGIAEDKITLTETGKDWTLKVDFKGMDSKIRAHLAYHAERFTLRAFFGKIELMGHRARDLIFDVDPKVGDDLVHELSDREFMVLSQWHKFNDAESKKTSIRELMACK